MGSGGAERWPTALGGSLAVPNVQALAASSCSLPEIPHRYIRPEARADDVICVDHATGLAEEIPVIDMGKLLDLHFSGQETERLNLACKDWGFFQLIHHGIPDEVIERMKADVGEFFKQPLEAKLNCSQPPGTVEGYGQAFVVSEEQKLDWSDILYLYSHPHAVRNFHLWPKHPPTFRDTLINYSQEVKKLADCLFEFMANNLGLTAAPEILTNVFKEGPQGIRMNYYPPCPIAHDKVLGISPHSDAVGLTLLLQVNQVPGLQIKRNGKWLPIMPLPGAFIVNLGDILEILSNGQYKSIEHRVTISKNMERLSIAAFHLANLNAFVGPLPDLLKGSRPRFKTMTGQDYARLVFSAKLDQKSNLDQMRLTIESDKNASMS